MTNEQILKQAISKAEKNGFSYTAWEDKIIQIRIALDINWEEHLVSIAPCLIFDPEFCKAFFGEEFVEVEILAGTCGYVAWKYYLQIMVIEDDPIKYLEQFIK